MSDPTGDPRFAALADLLDDADALAEVERLLARRRHGAEVVRARRFELVDGSGRVRAVLGDLSGAADEGEMPGLDLRDSRGRERVSLCLSDVGPLLAFDAEGNDALLLGVDDPGTAATVPGPYLTFLDRTGAPVAGWRLSEHGLEVEGPGLTGRG